MSLIVAIKKDDVVYLGADTRTVKGSYVRSRLSERDFKICRMGTCFVGGVGDVANIQVMTNHPEWFDLKGKPLTRRFLVQNVIPRYYDSVKDLEKLEFDEENSNSPKCGCEFLVTDGKRLFKIDNDFEVIELSKHGEIGCTERIALTLFLRTEDGHEPNELILKALRMSSYRNGFVGAPYVLINTRDGQFELVEA